MNLGRNYEHVRALLDLAKDVAALDANYLDYSSPLTRAVREWQKTARDLVAKMDT